MIQEDKELLLKDLSARLPYNVKCYNSKYRSDLAEEIICITVNYNHHCIQLGTYLYKLEQVKPYLFPMSSMTEEEKLIYEGLMIGTDNISYMLDVINWLNAHHFDYRGLIKKGLAIDATGLNIYD